LPIVATSLSHNFVACIDGCTNAGETDSEQLPESLKVLEDMLTIFFETRAREWVAACFLEKFQGGFWTGYHRPDDAGVSARTRIALDSWPRFL
jgi:hypothetical protein